MQSPSVDPTAQPGRWDALHALLRHIDGEIEELYRLRGITGVRPRFAYPLIRLHHAGVVTVNELAESLGRTQSAMSQTLSAMRDEGLIELRPGEDSRTREVVLTPRARALVPYLEAEWRATEAVVAELDDETDRQLSKSVDRLQRSIEAQSVAKRLATWMAHFESEIDSDATSTTRPPTDQDSQNATHDRP